jgi:hypothetical protein
MVKWHRADHCDDDEDDFNTGGVEGTAVVIVSLVLVGGVSPRIEGGRGEMEGNGAASPLCPSTETKAVAGGLRCVVGKRRTFMIRVKVVLIKRKAQPHRCPGRSATPSG